MNLSFLFRETKLGFFSNWKMGAMSIFISAFSLFFLYLFLLLTWNAFDVVNSAKTRLEMDVFLREGISKEQKELVISIIENFALVKNVEEYSSVKAEQEFVKEFPEYEPLLELFEAPIFPQKLVIYLKEYFLTPEFIKHLKEKINTLPFVEDVNFGETWLFPLYKTLVFLGFVDITLVFLLIFLLCIVMIQTLRLTIQTRKPVLELMELEGADEGTLRSPFLLEGWIYGFSGAILAGGILYLFLIMIYKVFGTSFAHKSYVVLFGLLFGSVLGYISSIIAISERKKL